MIIKKKLKLAIIETRFRISINLEYQKLFNCSNISFVSHSITSVPGSLLISDQFSNYDCLSYIHIKSF